MNKNGNAFTLIVSDRNAIVSDRKASYVIVVDRGDKNFSISTTGHDPVVNDRNQS